MVYVFLIFTFFSFFNLSLLFCSHANQTRLTHRTEKKEVPKEVPTDLHNLRIGDTKSPQPKTTPTQPDITQDSMVDHDGIYGKGL
ncbi:hypothetical protein KBC04_05085 [Candidatus Babeliales bacterium]|nr:hypothetical protein [Candidatus Babeliales bacterium]MBP9844234.1 hypothetical protein [Candidatus Babeliales bacterium]